MHANARPEGRARIVAQLAGGLLVAIGGAAALVWGVSAGPPPLPGPRLELSAARVDLGTVGQSDTASGSVTVRNSGDERLVIERLDSA